ncbi:hypothetical protein [Fulvivirga kasyanovii]|uniref:hypothetical protein n=1 Tax=Fulvivirga kasyanovii TaxID=396812 RepID=UPI0012BBA16C|nr:hypothetical protein [Fulvivirga kasyanovii]
MVKLYCSVTPAEDNSLKAEVVTFLNIISSGNVLKIVPPNAVESSCERLYWEVN